jgi:RNA polymerase sigma factor (sigma-70 family)
VTRRTRVLSDEEVDVMTTNATTLRLVTPRVPARSEIPDGSVDEPPDAALANRAAAGDDRAWQHIITRHGAYLASLGRKCRLSPEEVADAVQETWLNAVAHLSDLRNHDRLRSWLAAIMGRNCIKVIKDRRRDHEQLVGNFADRMVGGLRDDLVDVEHEVLAAERSAVLHRAMSLLPERDCELLRLCFVEDRSYGEITRRMAMPVGSIGPTRQRALRRLLRILEQAPDSGWLRAA